MTVEVTLATCSYSAFDRDMGVPVRTSVGYPRFIRYGVEYAKTLAPHGIFKNGNLPTLEFQEAAYLKRLTEHEDDLVRDLHDIGEKYPGLPLVLLCFENVHKGDVCHRQWAAAWFESRWGMKVPEISPGRARSDFAPTPRTLTLPEPAQPTLDLGASSGIVQGRVERPGARRR